MSDAKTDPKPAPTAPSAAAPAVLSSTPTTPPTSDKPAEKPAAPTSSSAPQPPPASPAPATSKPAEPKPKADDSSSDSSDDEPSLPAWLSPEQIAAARERLAQQRAAAEATAAEKRKAIGPINVDAIAQGIASGKFKNIIVMAGAGISVAAGIPDFRTPGTGLYANLGKYNLPYPEAVFDIHFFRENPQPFALLAKELYPGNFAPTACHFFFALLEKKGVLRRCFTQNIDTLERVAGVSHDMLVEAHGSFGLAHCIECRHEHSVEWTKTELFADRVPRCTKCKGLVKPDIVFFGENLPRRFFELRGSDFPLCDLLIVLGTSLKVHPFAGLVSAPPLWTPRLLINRESVGEGGSGFDFTTMDPRDIRLLGDVQEGIRTLVRKIGWESDLDKLISDWKANNPLPVTSPSPVPSASAAVSASASVPVSPPSAAPSVTPAAAPTAALVSPAAQDKTQPAKEPAPAAVQPSTLAAQDKSTESVPAAKPAAPVATPQPTAAPPPSADAAAKPKEATADAAAAAKPAALP